MRNKRPRGLCLVLAALITFVCAPLWAKGTSKAGTEGEQILLTGLPDNGLSLNTLSGGLDGLNLPSIASFVPQPAPKISAGSSFWVTAENGLFTASLVSFGAMNVADYFLTREAMKYPDMTETNPLLRPIVKNAATFALYKAGYIALNAYLLSRMHGSDKPMAWALSLASNLLVSLAVSHNIAQLRKVKGR